MKRSVLLLMLITTNLSIAQVTNQNLYDTIPTMPDHYRKRVAEFVNEPVVSGKILFLGNSITEGGNWRELTGDQTVINRGIGGDVTFGILNRLNDIIVRKPSKIFILIGINDIAKDFPDAVIIHNYRRIIEELKSKTSHTKIFIQSLLPVNAEYPRFPQHYDKGNHVLTVNKALRELAIASDVSFINLYPVFIDAQGRLDVKYTYYGLHLNAEGYKRWAKFLQENDYLR
jgi:lysophospholipase L1-like esterase